MKPVPAILTALITALLVVSPALVAAAGTISVTTNATSYNDSQQVTISGTASPAPGAGVNALVTVTNPNGQTVYQYPEAVTSGAFSASFTIPAGNPSWITGTYTVNASISGYTPGTTTFSYTAPAGTGSYNVTAALIQILADIKSLNASLGTQHTALSNQLTALAGQVTALQTSVGNLQSSVTQLQNTVSSMSQAVNDAKTAAQAAQTAAENAGNSVGSTQTYVLVVAVLAAITLVLELAILVRRLS